VPLGWRLGGPSVAQGPPKRLARVALGRNLISALFATRVQKWGAGGVGFTDLDRSTPGSHPNKRKALGAPAVAGPLRLRSGLGFAYGKNDDNLWRGEFPPRQANSGLVGDPGCAARLMKNRRHHRHRP
jgi:hypothetical protein